MSINDKATAPPAPPANWPPRPGDIWEDTYGVRFAAVGGDYGPEFVFAGTTVAVETLRMTRVLSLVERKSGAR